MKISEIQANQKKIDIEGEITDITPIKEFSKFGKVGKVATAIIQDDSGKVQLTLWDEQIDTVKQGDKVRITNAYAKEWQGELQLNVGRFGTLELIK